MAESSFDFPNWQKIHPAPAIHGASEQDKNGYLGAKRYKKILDSITTPQKRWPAPLFFIAEKI
jgi:hypothetical protein